MSFKSGILAVLAAGFLAAGSAHAEVNTAPSVASLIEKTPGAKGVFVETTDHGARHVQSGLLCPLTFPNVNLWHLQVYNAEGLDVGCDYGRQDKAGNTATKLTIYAVKAEAGDTPDAAFARYQAEVKGAWPDAVVKGAAITFTGDVTEDQKNIRSEEYELLINGRRFQSDLIVTIKNGWVLEIRATSPIDVGTDEDGKLAISDLALPAFSLLQTLSSLDADKP